LPGGTARRRAEGRGEATSRRSRQDARLNKARQITSLSAALHEECKWEEAEEKKRDEIIRAAVESRPDHNRRSSPHSTGRTGRRSIKQVSPGRGQTGRHPSRDKQYSTGRTGRRSSKQGSPGRDQTSRHPFREQHYSTSRTGRPNNQQETTGQSERRRPSPSAVASYHQQTPGRSVLVSSSSNTNTAPLTRTDLGSPP